MTERRYATDKDAVKTLQAGLKKLPEKWVMCRDMRHAWAVLNDFHVPASTPGQKAVTLQIQRELVCMRCETVRYESYERTRDGRLDKVAQGYGYPEGYQIPGVPRGVKPQQIIQAEQYRRAMEKAAGAARGQRETAER